jgi:DNA-directed RNA polymerase subunit RPC12/RpoP
MIDTLLNLLFRCSHRRLSRPVTPTSKAGAPKGDTYIVCLDCGGRFSYDPRAMKMGRRLARQEGSQHS